MPQPWSWRGVRRRVAALQPVEEIDRAAQVRDHDAAAHHQPDREGLEHLVAVDAGLLALGDVVADAVVAAQHQRGDQAQQLLGLHVQRAGLVGLGIEREEAPHHLVGLGEDALVHALRGIR